MCNSSHKILDQLFSISLSLPRPVGSTFSLVATLHGSTAAICDKVKQSTEGAIQAVIEFVVKRGNELSDNDISRTTQSLLSAAVHVTEKHLRLETLGAISSLAENTSSKIVFTEVFATAGREIATKDVSRVRAG